jgi:hypothetical protein
LSAYSRSLALSLVAVLHVLHRLRGKREREREREREGEGGDG